MTPQSYPIVVRCDDQDGDYLVIGWDQYFNPIVVPTREGGNRTAMTLKRPWRVVEYGMTRTS